MIKLQQSWVKEGGMKLHLDLSRQEMETNPNKIAPCGVIVIVEITRRDCLTIMSLYQSASPQTKPIRIRSQIKVFSIPQRARARLPLKLIDLSRIQTIMPGQAGTQWLVMRHHACTLRVVVKISSCGEGDLRLWDWSRDKVAPCHELLPGPTWYNTASARGDPSWSWISHRHTSDNNNTGPAPGQRWSQRRHQRLGSVSSARWNLLRNADKDFVIRIVKQGLETTDWISEIKSEGNYSPFHVSSHYRWPKPERSSLKC